MMALRAVAAVLASCLLSQTVECHVEDATSLVQSTLHFSPASEADALDLGLRTQEESVSIRSLTISEADESPTWQSAADAAELQGLREVRLKDGDIQISFWRKLRNITSEGSIARLDGRASAENVLRSLAWEFNASETEQPKEYPELALTMQYRARLGNRLFQWAALVSIAAEAGAKVAAPFNPKYNPESTPQLSKMGPLIWQGKEFEWLGSQPKKCHIWDRIPVKLDWNMENLGNFTLGGIPKGELQLQAEGPLPQRTQNWARTWADAITRTVTPTKCRVVELDGYWQSAEYFVHHLDMIRSLFWHEESAVKAKSIMDGWLQHDPPVGSVVGVHLRLGDYVGAGRNLNMSYYREGFKVVKMYRNTSQLTCMLFSDDIKLAQKVGEELEGCDKVVPVLKCPKPWVDPYRCRGEEISDWVQFYMMSQMENLIIADSSYSFWSAVLSPNAPLVVVPNITWPLGVASRGDYAYLNNPLYGWVNIDATLGSPDSKAVREHLHLAEDRSAAPHSEWAA